MPPAPRFRLPALLPVLLLLAACESELSIDLSTSPASAPAAVVLGITEVELLSEDGSVDRLDVADAGAVDLQDYADGERLPLATDSGEAEDDYVALRASFDTAEAYVEDGDGNRTDLVLDTVGSHADLDIALDDDESADVVLTLELPFSLVDRRSDLGQYRLRPVVRAAMTDSAGRIEGRVANALLDAAACRQDRARAEGVAVYVFAGSGVTPADYYADGGVVQRDPPLASAPVRYDAGTGDYRYAVHFLPPGDYTVALSCDADREHPQQDDGLAFTGTRSVELDEGETAEADFGA